MKKILSICTLIIAISIIGSTIKPVDLALPTFNAAALVDATLNTKAKPRLVFSDEFNGDKLNLKKWMTELQWGRTNGDTEWQYYLPTAPFSFLNGHLRIKADRKWTYGKPYYSGALITYKSFKFTYGIVQVRARIPHGKGLWPALWLLDYLDGPEEIDIMEALGHEPDTVYMTLHFPTISGTKSLGQRYAGPNFASQMHTYSVDWAPTYIDWYVDGVKRYRLTSGIPSKPMYLIMNLAVGGLWPGYPDKYTKFPAYFQIDYVRIYQR